MAHRWLRSLIIFLGLLICLTPPVEATIGMSSSRGRFGEVKVVQTFPADMAQGVSPTTPLTVEFSGNINQDFYQTINLTLFQGNDVVDGEMFYNPSARQIMFKPKRPLQSGVTYTAHLTWAEGAGNGEKVWNFQVGDSGFNNSMSSQTASSDQGNNDGTTGATASPLRIVQASMAAGSIEPGRALEITFSEPIDLASLRDAPVRLIDGKNQVGIDYRLSRDRKTLTLVPRAPLQNGKEYTVTVSQSITGSSGSRLARNVAIPFKMGSFQETNVADNIIGEYPAEGRGAIKAGSTSEAYENASFNLGTNRSFASNKFAQAQNSISNAPVQLKLIGLSPQNNQTVNNLSQPVTVAFSTDIRPETLNEFTFRLEDEYGPVPAKIRYDASRRIGILTPIGVLDAGKTYRVVITQGITDPAGRPLSKGITSTFTTAYASAPISDSAYSFAANTNSPAISGQAAYDQPAYNESPKINERAGNFDSRSSSRSSTQQVFPRERTTQLAYMRQPLQETAEIESFEVANEEDTIPSQSLKRNITQNSMTSRRTTKRNSPMPTRLSSFKVTKILPGANAQSVARNSRIYVYFSEPPNQSTLNPINISVFGDQRRVEGKVVYDSRRMCAIFIPSEPLKADTEYKVIISDKIYSSKGEPISNRLSWQFTTASENQPVWRPRPAYEADASFDIPLVDGRSAVYRAPASKPNLNQTNNISNDGGNFITLRENHWAFKSLRHIASKGLLTSFPFRSTSNVTRYEFANALSSALGNLKAQRSNPKQLRLKVADMVELYQLLIEFKSELRSFGVDTRWFEAFMARQGVLASDVEARVAALNRRTG